MNDHSEKAEDLKSDQYALLFGTRRSVRYHMRRCRFFDQFHSFTNAIGVIAGSSAIFSALQDYPYIAACSAALVAVASAIDLVVGTGAMARLHNDLAKKFIHLEKEIVLAGEPTEGSLRKFTACRLEIEAEEPPILRTLDRLCHNEMLRAEGHSSNKIVRVPWLQKRLAHFVSFEPPRSAP
ncbi:MAG: hypothetical protein ABL960_13850 [Nitrospira sp.]|nr:MAG: hypothetical protein E8D44_02095 [Nitrospira sp.]